RSAQLQKCREIPKWIPQTQAGLVAGQRLLRQPDDPAIDKRRQSKSARCNQTIGRSEAGVALDQLIPPIALIELELDVREPLQFRLREKLQGRLDDFGNPVGDVITTGS